MDDVYWTRFYDTEGMKLGSLPGHFFIPLYKGMRITIHSSQDEYVVKRWEFHLGHADENAGLRVVLEATGRAALYHPPRAPSPDEPKETT
ncbi:MAG: hypothetical protein H6739_29315 [Alphaproteobacteria bacterium]|nr:hypothetical protein [Alphaproteobacteria bacterium]